MDFFFVVVAVEEEAVVPDAAVVSANARIVHAKPSRAAGLCSKVLSVQGSYKV